MRVLLLNFILILSFNNLVFAQGEERELPLLPPVVAELLLLENPEGADVECSNYLEKLKLYQTLQNKLFTDIPQFFLGYTSSLKKWHKTLVVFEGRLTEFKEGDFQVLYLAGLRLQATSEIVADSALVLDDLMYSLMELAVECSGQEELFDKMELFNDSVLETLNLISQYMAEISTEFVGLHTTIAELEAQKQIIAEGSFLPLYSYADEAEGSSGLGEAAWLINEKYLKVYIPQLAKIIKQVENPISIAND